MKLRCQTEERKRSTASCLCTSSLTYSEQLIRSEATAKTNLIRVLRFQAHCHQMEHTIRGSDRSGRFQTLGFSNSLGHVCELYQKLAHRMAKVQETLKWEKISNNLPITQFKYWPNFLIFTVNFTTTCNKASDLGFGNASAKPSTAFPEENKSLSYNLHMHWSDTVWLKLSCWNRDIISVSITLIFVVKSAMRHRDYLFFVPQSHSFVARLSWSDGTLLWPLISP